MKSIRLTKGQFAIVDDDMFEYLSQWKWHTSCKGYAIRTIHGKRPNEKSKTIFMHRIINKTPKDLQTDHINRNKLDNRRVNLRNATNTLNQLNKGLQKNNTSGFAGITLHKPNNKWWARIVVNEKQISLGCYSSIQGAILARKWGERLYAGI